MKITIERTNNGAILVSKENNLKVAYKFDETELTDLMIMLYTVAEEIYKPFSGYDKFTPEIQIVHGRKYACLDKKCSICNK